MEVKSRLAAPGRGDRDRGRQLTGDRPPPRVTHWHRHCEIEFYWLA
jgi:hypothetical protein